MRDVVIIDGARTPIGSFGGSLRSIHASDLGALVIREALRRANVEPERVEEVIMGCVGQVGENAYIARTAAVKGGVPKEANALTVNRACSSGLQAIVSAAQAIRAGDIDIAVAGGVETMSQAPFYIRGARWGEMRMGHQKLEDGLIAMLSDPFGYGHMGETAERVAEKYNVSREEQDKFALQSHQRAVAAIDRGDFEAEIVPVEVPDPKKRGETMLFSVDEHPRRDASLEKIAKLKPVFRKDGTVTAGNASAISDGAAAVVVMGADVAERLNLTPKARLVASAMAGNDPQYMGYAPTYAIPKVLQKAGLSIDDIDLVELNEAFASQAIAVIRDAGLDPERTNPNGGAIALGHPIGATANILSVKAIYHLHREQKRYAMVTMCVGGGQALAAIFERI